MGVRVKGLYRGGGGIYGRYYIGATTVAGALQMRDTATNTASEVIPAAAASVVNGVGLATEAVTYSTTQSDYDGMPGYRMSGEEGTVGIISDPLQVIALRCSGGATTGTALATAAPANILTNDTADTTGLTVTETTVGTITFVGGLMIGRTGNNAGIVRVISAHTDSTSTAVTVPYPRTIAANDTFIRVPYSKKVIDVDLTSNFVEANAIIEVGTAAGMLSVFDVDFDIINDEVTVYVVMRDHILNPVVA